MIPSADSINGYEKCIVLIFSHNKRSLLTFLDHMNKGTLCIKVTRKVWCKHANLFYTCIGVQGSGTCNYFYHDCCWVYILLNGILHDNIFARWASYFSPKIVTKIVVLIWELAPIKKKKQGTIWPPIGPPEYPSEKLRANLSTCTYLFFI